MVEDDNKTLWCGNLAEQVTEELLYELFLQAGPLEKVKIAKDRDGRQKSFAFVTYRHEVSVPYAIKLFSRTSLFHKTLSLQSRGRVAPLPPPIRCLGPEPMFDFPAQMNIVQQFSDMTNDLRESNYSSIHTSRLLESGNNLVMASLQANWSHRHHPYKATDNNRDDYRNRVSRNDNYKASNRNKHSNDWRDRRNHKKGTGYHNRD